MKEVKMFEAKKELACREEGQTEKSAFAFFTKS
jgi:hypothetical protein